MRSYAVAIGTAVLIALLVSLSPAQRKRQRVSARISIEQEAQQQAVKYWNSVLTQCGDSYLTKKYYPGDQERLSPSARGYWIYELKGISVKTDGMRIEQHLSETDILNGAKPRRPGEGIEWTGRANLWSRVARDARRSEDHAPGKMSWAKWTDYPITILSVNFKKVDGKWRFSPDFGRYVPVKCDLSDVETAQ